MTNSEIGTGVLKRRIISELSKLAQDRTAILQNFACCCVSKHCIISVLDWPDSLPDISLSENLWIIVKERLTKCDHTTKDKVYFRFSRPMCLVHDGCIKYVCKILTAQCLELLIKPKGVILTESIILIFFFNIW